MRDAVQPRIAKGGVLAVILVSFVVAFEILIMISPFAFYFYAVFNPILLTLNQSGLTRWLTSFFLPHMIVPPDALLTCIRVAGSALFLLGLFLFLICAGQVYWGKLFKRGTATGGFYRVVRHPQYVGLSLAALGLAIMWPRLLTLVLLALMMTLYDILALDEERRMLKRHGDAYRQYRERTGMFVPRRIEKMFRRETERERQLNIKMSFVVFLVLGAVIVGAGFLLRSYTVHHLPLMEVGGVDVITIAGDDAATAAELMHAVLRDSAVAARLGSIEPTPEHRLLAYVIPVDYVMQGMIANTGDEWKLFEQHKTLGMITEYILHPFSHLTGGHAHLMDMSHMHHGLAMYAMPAMQRRVIFIKVSSGGEALQSATDDFDINVLRTPLVFVDVHLHTDEILKVQNTPAGSEWGTVPTPTF